MSFIEAMRFVEDEHHFPARLEDLHEHRLRDLLQRSGLQARLRAIPIVVVGGSCGKASTARMLAFILRAMGVPRIGLGTKPPLRETADGHRERYQLVGADGAAWISPQLFTQIVNELRAHLAGSSEAYAPYDLRMWILLRMFVEARVSLGIVEANIGLRHDPTAAVEAPAAMILTRVATDHASLLQAPPEVVERLAGLGDAAGPAWHKAGGLKDGVPSVIGAQDPQVMEAILSLAPPPARVYGRDFAVEDARCGLGGSDVRLRIGEESVEAHVAAVGAYQVENAATAAAAAALLAELGVVRPRFSVARAVRDGLGAVETPGRMQILGRDPLTIFNLAAGVPKLRGMMHSVLQLSGQRPIVAALSVIERAADPRGCVAEVVEAPSVRAFVATTVLREGDTLDLPAEQLAAWARELRPDIEVMMAEPDDVVATCDRMCPLEGVVLLVGDGLGAFLDLVTTR